jgi:DNA-binding transcriptional MerR regulator
MTERPLGPSEVARLTGVSTDTLRHYEKRGLLPAPLRSGAGYRRYAPAAVERVKLIQRALDVGFSLRDLARVFAERAKGGAPCRSVRALVGDRLGDVERRIDELTTLKAELTALLADWDTRLAGTPAGGRAHLLDALAARPGLAPPIRQSIDRSPEPPARRTRRSPGRRPQC